MNALVPISGVVQRGRGRPPLEFDQDIADEIVERLSNGEFLVRILEGPDMPSVMTVWRWGEAHPEFKVAIAHARDLGSDGWVERGIEVAITPEDGRVITYRSDGSVELRREDAVASRKLAAWGFMEGAKRMNPRKYGDRVALDGAGGNTMIINGNVNNVTLENTPQEAAEIYAEKLKNLG